MSGSGIARGLLVFMGLALAFPAAAQTSQTLVYDVHGRLTDVLTMPRSGVPQTSRYEYDPAGNRTTRLTIGGEPEQVAIARSRVIIVPLNGFTLIPIGAPATPSSNRAPAPEPSAVQALPFEPGSARDSR